MSGALEENLNLAPPLQNTTAHRNIAVYAITETSASFDLTAAAGLTHAAQGRIVRIRPDVDIYYRIDAATGGTADPAEDSADATPANQCVKLLAGFTDEFTIFPRGRTWLCVRSAAGGGASFVRLWCSSFQKTDDLIGDV